MISKCVGGSPKCPEGVEPASSERIEGKRLAKKS